MTEKSFESKEIEYPKWCKGKGEVSQYLPNLLDFASKNYERHTNWFLKHRDTALTQLTALITAEIVIRQFLDPGKNSIQLIFILLSIFSFILAGSGHRSCNRCFRASLENALLINKIIWIMGLSNKVNVNFDPDDIINAPAADDETFFVERYVTDSYNSKTTKEYLKKHLINKGKTTYFWGLVTIWTLGIAGFVIGIAFTVLK